MLFKKEIEFKFNGLIKRVAVPLNMTALTMVREELGYTGTKYGCGEGECGACTLWVDGKSVNACLMLAVECDGRSLTTIETDHWAVKMVQSEMVALGAAQCGFCTPGMIMQGSYLLSQKEKLSREQIKEGMEGNLCRCTGYKKIIDAIEVAFAKKGEAYGANQPRS